MLDLLWMKSIINYKGRIELFRKYVSFCRCWYTDFEKEVFELMKSIKKRSSF